MKQYNIAVRVSGDEIGEDAVHKAVETLVKTLSSGGAKVEAANVSSSGSRKIEIPSEVPPGAEPAHG